MAIGNSTLIPSNSTQAPVEGIADARRRLELIEGYVCLTAITLSFLSVFGSIRRRSHSQLFRFLVRTAYVLSTCFLSYTIGQMQSASFRNELFAIWAVFLMIVVGGTDSITAYSLEGNEKTDSYNLLLFVQSFWMGWLIGTYDHETKFRAPLFILWTLTVVRTRERVQAMSLASRSSGLMRNTKLIADFMEYEHELSNKEEIDPSCMEGYNYLVRGEDEKKLKIGPPHYHKQLTITNEVITTQKIWRCKGRLLNSEGDPEGKLKDICRSFALFRLLCRRFAGYPFAESSHQKTWNLVRNGLLSKEGDEERAFRVIEVELGFLYDFFYTKYPAIFNQGTPVFRILQVFIVIIGTWFGATTLWRYQSPNGYLHLTTVRGRNVDVLVTGIVMIAILFVEIVQVYFLIFSDWSKILWVCKYVQKPNSKFREIMAKIVCHKNGFKPWGRKLGQFSLLESSMSDHFNIVYKYTTDLFSSRKGTRESPRIELPVQVKKTVTHSLRINGRRLTNGIASLERNGFMDQLSWACRLETQTHVIMVWHIATCLCEIIASPPTVSSENFIVATSLSKYCAYLAAFAPRFLPDHAYTTEFIIDQVILEAGCVLKGCNTPAGMYKKLMTLPTDDPQDKMITRGAKLGKLLIEGTEDEEVRWRILADLWAELMLFVAPSNDVNVHGEYLARGGEFVTHLWALLSHAGILERDPNVQDV